MPEIVASWKSLAKALCFNNKAFASFHPPNHPVQVQFTLIKFHNNQNKYPTPTIPLTKGDSNPDRPF
jgi:hypothetical protein